MLRQVGKFKGKDLKLKEVLLVWGYSNGLQTHVFLLQSLSPFLVTCRATVKSCQQFNAISLLQKGVDNPGSCAWEGWEEIGRKATAIFSPEYLSSLCIQQSDNQEYSMVMFILRVLDLVGTGIPEDTCMGFRRSVNLPKLYVKFCIYE